MKQAEKFNRPIITIIDTPGAYPGIEAEERGQARAIALNIFEMMKLRVPILVIILSEGGSGGALAIGVGDYTMMFENAIYSILSPEGFASILFKDSQQAEKAASMMKLTAKDLLAFNVIDQIILEKEGLHENPLYGIEQLKKYLSKNLSKLMKQDKDNLLNHRYEKFRSIGIYSEEGENNDSSEDQNNI
jgi:acetyl-CoA carboxylase carboxyl transferase subunit alpha